MPNVDDIINRLLADRRIREGAAFSSRSYVDQPIIERGSDLKARMDKRRAERAKRHQLEANERQDKRQARRDRSNNGATPSHATESAAGSQRPRQPQAQQSARTEQTPSLFPVEQMREFSRKINSTFGQVVGEPFRIPEAIQEMRELERGSNIHGTFRTSYISARIFRKQAELMADYEDDFDYEVQYGSQYLTYAEMSARELRAYFSWRTKLRAGQLTPCPYSFACVYLYELLCGVGTTPGIKALSDMQSFALAYREVDSPSGNRLISSLGKWMRDYAVYYNIPNVLPKRRDELREAVLTLMVAEYGVLEQAGRNPKVKSPWSAMTDYPNTQQLFEALDGASTYRATGSRLVRDEPELYRDVASDVFREMVLHCSKRRKTDYVEGLFGYATRDPYIMFSSAIFYDPETHPDATVLVSKVEGFVCKDGHWSRIQANEARQANRELGLLLHEIDYEIREATSYAYPLKQRKVPAYVEKIVKKAVAARLTEREEAERRRITIDRSKLSGIRSAAALTRDALLTDEDRGEEVFEPSMTLFEIPATMTVAQAKAEPQPSPAAEASVAPTPAPAESEPPVAAAPSEPQQAAAASPEQPAQDGPLSPLEHRFVTGLMAGQRASDLLLPTDPFVSVVADSINEKFFDLIGDAVIDFDGDEPVLVEDYLEDIKEVLGQ